MAKFIRRFWLHLLLTLSPAVALADELAPVTFQDFKAGLVTDFDSSDICDTCAQDLQNVDVKNGYIAKRRGSTKQNTSVVGSHTAQPVRFLHEFVDSSNNFWLIFVTSNSIYGSKDGGVTNQLLTSTYGVTNTSRFAATNAFGKVYMVDGSTNAIIFDGTTVTASTAIPKGKTIEFFAERLVVGGVTGSESTLYMSEAGDPLDFVTDTDLDSDAFSTQIRQANGFPIRSAKRFRNGLMVFKDNSMDFFTLSADGLTFSQTPVSSRIGTTFPETVHSADNVIRWLAFDGFYEFNGAIVTRISEPIQSSLEGLTQLSSVSRFYTETTKTSFDAGTSTGVSTAVIQNSVVLSTWTDTDTTGSDFAAGTLTRLTTQTVSGDLYLSTANTNVENNGFESGSGADADNWDQTGFQRTASETAGGCSITPDAGSWFMGDNGTTGAFKWSVLDSSDTVLSSSTFHNVTVSGDTNCVYTTTTVALSSYRGRNIKVRVDDFTSSFIVTSDLFFASGEDMTFRFATDGGALNTVIGLDTFTGGRSTHTTGSFTSSTFDTTLSSPAWLVSTITYQANGHNVTFQTQSSADGVTFDSAVSHTPGSAVASANKRYLRYLISFSTNSTGSALPFVSDVTFGARNLHGRYLSGAFSTSGATSWFPFTGNVTTNDGSQTFEIYVDTDTDVTIQNGAVVIGTVVSSQTITSGDTPSISIAGGSFARVGSTFTITAATQAPQMDDFTVNWAEGNSTFYPTGMYFDGDSYWGVSVTSSTGNDTIFIYDLNKAWTKYTELPAFYTNLYRNRPFIGSNIQGDIIKFQVDNLYTDYNDAAISAYWTSKDFDMGYPLTPKTLLRYYITADRSINGNLTFSYGPNRGSLTTTSHDLDSLSGFYRSVVKPNSFTYSEGLQHRFKFSDSTNNATFKILSITGRFNILTSP